jgi:hypothetical protein
MASLLSHNDLQNNKKIKSSVNGNGPNNSNSITNGNANNNSSGGSQSNGKLNHSQQSNQGSFINNGQNSPFNNNKHQQQQIQQPGQNLFPPGGIPPNLLNLFK